MNALASPTAAAVKQQKLLEEKPTHIIRLEDNRQALIYLNHTSQTIYRKQKVNGTTVKDSAGKPVFFSMTVPGTTLNILIEKAGEIRGTLSSRSCCKPPDNFCRKTGTKMALLNAFKKDAKKEILTKTDRKTIILSLIPGFFHKKDSNTKVKVIVPPIPEVATSTNKTKKKATPVPINITKPKVVDTKKEKEKP